MNCETLENVLLDLLYEELEGKEKEEAEGHLASCPMCQKKAEGFGLVRRVSRMMPEPVMPQLAYAALLAEAQSAAQRWAQPNETAHTTQPKTLRQAPREEPESFWDKLRTGFRLLFSPAAAVAASGLLVVFLGFLVSQEGASPARSKSIAPPMMADAGAPQSLPASPAKPLQQDMLAVAEPKLQLDEAEERAGEGEAAEIQKEEPKKKEAISLKLLPPEPTMPVIAAADKTPGAKSGYSEAGGMPASAPVSATPGDANGDVFLTQSKALAGDGKCSDAEKTARAISAGTESWCLGLQASAQCFQKNNQEAQTRTIYTELRSFDKCAKEAEKSLAALDSQKSQVGGKAGKPTIRSDYKKKDKPSPSPKSPQEDLSDPFKSPSTTPKSVEF